VSLLASKLVHICSVVISTITYKDHKLNVGISLIKDMLEHLVLGLHFTNICTEAMKEGKQGRRVNGRMKCTVEFYGH